MERRKIHIHWDEKILPYVCIFSTTITNHEKYNATENGNECNLRRIKEWICSERPITICDIVKVWLCQGFRIWSKGDVTRRQRPMRALVSFTLQRNV